MFDKSAWYQENKEKIKKQIAEWQRNNREKTRTYSTRWRNKNKEHVRAYSRIADRKRKYGLTGDEIKTLFAENPSCSVCYSTTRLVIDHCHKSNKIRGVLCSHCNLALGHVKDRADVLRKLATYLESNK